MHERRQPKAQPLSLGRDSQRDDDCARRGHGSNVAVTVARLALAAAALACAACESSHMMQPNVAEAQAHAHAGVTSRQAADERSDLQARVEFLLGSAETTMDGLYARQAELSEASRQELGAVDRRFQQLRASLQSEIDAFGAVDDVTWRDLRAHVGRDMRDLQALVAHVDRAR
jgi:hypothetical protein